MVQKTLYHFVDHMVHVDKMRGMSRKTPGVMPPKRYRRLLTEAAREFATAGFELASLNTIIRTCRMSKSSFYHYFASKEALFDAVVNEAAMAMARDLNAPHPDTLLGPDFWERIAEFVTRAVAVSSREEWYTDFGKLFYLTDVSAKQSPALRRTLAQIADWLARTLAAGRSCGAVRDDLPATLQAELVFAVLQAMDRWSLQHIHEFNQKNLKQLAMRQLNTLRRVLAPDDSGEHGRSVLTPNV